VEIGNTREPEPEYFRLTPHSGFSYPIRINLNGLPIDSLTFAKSHVYGIHSGSAIIQLARLPNTTHRCMSIAP
jgi:hypothetical protein